MGLTSSAQRINLQGDAMAPGGEVEYESCPVRHIVAGSLLFVPGRHGDPYSRRVSHSCDLRGPCRMARGVRPAPLRNRRPAGVGVRLHVYRPAPAPPPFAPVAAAAGGPPPSGPP